MPKETAKRSESDCFREAKIKSENKIKRDKGLPFYIILIVPFEKYSLIEINLKLQIPSYVERATCRQVYMYICYASIEIII